MYFQTPRSRRSLGLVMVASLAPPSTAAACDSSYTAYSCNNGGSDVCVMIGTDWVCDLAVNGATSGGELWIVYSDSLCQGASDYCDTQGSNTACETPLTSAPTECPSGP